MKASNFAILTLTVCALGACSTTDSEQKNKLFDYKAAAVKVRTLETPPDLTAPVGNDRYSIPGTDGEGVARYSDFSKAPAGSSVLPETRNVRLMRDGTQRWLLVNDKAENIWPVVKAFWQEIGLNLKVDNPQAGVMETAWAENLAKPGNRGARNVLGGALDDLYFSGERDQFHTRLERSQDGNSTEIYIKHSGQQEAQADKAACKCPARANDPELEATMLQMLMTKLAGGTTPRVEGQRQATQVPSQTPGVKLQTLADGSKSILLSEPFDKSWRKVSLALEQAGIALEDKDRSKGVFFLRTADKEASYQVNVRENAGGCEVTVSNGKGGSTPDMQRIVDTLYQNLGKQ